MLNVWSNQLVDVLLNNKIIEEKEKDIYAYGFQIIISSMIGILMVGAIGIIFNRFIESVLFLVVFISIREYTGGYHANTFLFCSVLFISLYFILLVFTEMIYKNFELYHIIFILLIHLFTVLKYSPIENERKPLTQKVVITKRKKSIIISIIWSLLTLVLFSWLKKLSVVITLTLGIVTMLMLIEKLKERRDKHE